ncbi:MAG: hypothetical protein ACE5MK_12800 [Acidobacteriota bacterium]
MAWEKTLGERRCGTCGVTVEHWLLRNNRGHQVAEATFCPTCYADVKRVFDAPHPVRDGFCVGMEDSPKQRWDFPRVKKQVRC